MTDLLLLDDSPARSLTERMLAKQPRAGWRLWIDLSRQDYWYLAEAPKPATSAQAAFNGVRVTIDAAGAINGRLSEAEGFAWDDRYTFGGWS